MIRTAWSPPGPDSFNPFDFIDPDSDLAIDDCRDVAESLVVRTGQEKEPFWLDAAESWLTAMSAMLVNLKPTVTANLAELKTLVSDTTLREQAIKRMIDSDAWDGILSRLGPRTDPLEGQRVEFDSYFDPTPPPIR